MQDDATDDELDPNEPDEDPTCLLENPTPGDILHIDKDDAERISGALLNQYNRKLVKVFNLEFSIITSGPTLLLGYMVPEQTKTTINLEFGKLH